MAAVRRSRYKISTNPKPYRFTAQDADILRLFGPEAFSQYRRLTAEQISVRLGRPLNKIQARLRHLYDDPKQRYIKRYHPFHNQIGGSKKIVYLLDKDGAKTMRTAIAEDIEKQVEHGKLTLTDAQNQIEKLQAEVRYDRNFNPQAYHDFDHELLNNDLRVLFYAACRDFPDLTLLASYPDKRLTIVAKDNGGLRVQIEPDQFNSWRQNSTGKTANFAVEIQRASRKTKRSARQRNTIADRMRDYLTFHTQQLYLRLPKHQAMADWKNLRVLFITDTGPLEHENLIRLAHDLSPGGKGLRLFWFARMQDFRLQEPMSLLQKVWRTPVTGAQRFSLLE